ncbi:MAG: glycosyltransferase family 2 protein [Prevotella sp.]|nr:glycosyltransferase family 2 protein [Prevotella sp.]
MPSSSCQFSLLVAVYNAERYLSACLDSLVGQTLRDIQIICIDDASTDNSWNILQHYAERDCRIELIRLDINAGQAHARNEGLRRARGRYIGFVDSDDWLSPDCLQQTLETFAQHPQTGCVLLRTIYSYQDGSWKLYPMEPFTAMSGEEAFVKSLTWKIHGIYVVRADIHRRFPYDESARAYSDDNTTRLHYLASTEVRCCQGTYFYRQHAGSTSHRISFRRFDYLTANRSMKRQLEQMGAAESILSLYENRRWLNLVDVYQFWFNHHSDLSDSEKDKGLRMIKQSWQSIETHRLTLRNKLKFGYIPFRPFWWLFRMEENLYFRLKRMGFRRRL